ncbi:MAG: Ig-like domain-containing protein, partial [Chloroflexota bacterium]
VSLTAVISTTIVGVGMPVGEVSFYDGAAALGPPVPVLAGMAAITVPHLTVGTHSLTASFTPAPNFLGNSDFAPSRAGFQMGAGQATDSIRLVSSNPTANVGQMTLTLSMIGAARLPDAVLVDGATKQRIAIIGPYDVGSAIRIATP